MCSSDLCRPGVERHGWISRLPAAQTFAMIPLRNRFVSVAVLGMVGALLLASCSSDDSSDSGAAADSSSTTVALSPAEAAQAYTEPGPYPVGITTLELDGPVKGVKVEVWYPAVDGSTGTDRCDTGADGGSRVACEYR